MVPEGKVHTLGMSHFLHAHIRTLHNLPLWLQAFLRKHLASPATKNSNDIATHYMYHVSSWRNTAMRDPLQKIANELECGVVPEAVLLQM